MIRYLRISLLLAAFCIVAFQAFQWFTGGSIQEPPAVPPLTASLPGIDPEAQPPVPPPADSRIQVALILDTSNSMDGLIDQAKSQLWKMVNELSKTKRNGMTPQIEIAIFEYGNSNISALNGYVRQVGRLTHDLEWVSAKLFELSTKGGEEYCAMAIRDAKDLLDWSKKESDLKMIFIAGNEPFSQGNLRYRDVCKEAKKKGIIINTIHCGDYDTGVRDFWKDGAQFGGGEYMIINQEDKVVHISTPYDDQILKLNQDLNGTYDLYYGLSGDANFQLQDANDVSAITYGYSNGVTRSFFKSSDSYNNANWDLVDMTKGKSTESEKLDALSEVDEATLPKELQGKSNEERLAEIEKKSKEREEIKAKIKELEAKVEAYRAEKEAEINADGSTLDNVLMSTITKQAKAKGYSVR